MRKIKPKVSVVVLTYNQEEMIGRTLDSVLSQKCDFPYEIIIGDDASTDRTEEICRQYAQKYPEIIRYIRNESNKGILHNYYDCVLEAEGEYISDIGGDDFWIDENKLQKEVDILNNDSETVLVCTDWTFYDEKEGAFRNPWPGGRYPYKDFFQKENLAKRLLVNPVPPPVHLCTAMYRKNAFLELYEEDPYVFRNKEFLMEDKQLIVLLATKGDYRYIDDVTLAYSVNEKSVSGTSDFKKNFDLYSSSLKIGVYLADKIGANDKETENKHKHLARYVVMQAFHAQDRERMNRAAKLLKEIEIDIPVKTKIILGISKYKPLWTISRKIWQRLRKK